MREYEIYGHPVGTPWVSETKLGTGIGNTAKEVLNRARRKNSSFTISRVKLIGKLNPQKEGE